VLPILLALALGICISAAYVFPLVVYQRFFDASAFVTHDPFTELGRNFLYISLAQVQNYRMAIPAIASATCLTLFVAWGVWQSGAALLPASVCC
jgi:hypothetical protein